MFAPSHYRDFVADMAGLRARLRCAVEDGSAPASELRDALDEMERRFAVFNEKQAAHFAKHSLVSANAASMATLAPMLSAITRTGE